MVYAYFYNYDTGGHKEMILGFAGTGNMGGALAKAASQNGSNQLLLSNRHSEKAEKLAELIGGTVCDNLRVAAEADYIFLGVKPQMLEGMLIGIEDTLKARTTPFVIVSMVAGTSIAKLQQLLGFQAPIIRIMPNTPVSVGAGMILYACSREVTQEAEDAFLSSMVFAGRFSRIDESLADISSVVSGCGPAFVSMFLEAVADGGVACGMPRKQAMEVAAQMMLGTAKLMLESHAHPGAMKDAVCSPGGTTIQGVRTLEEAGFRGAVMDAVIAAYEKTLTL